MRMLSLTVSAILAISSSTVSAFSLLDAYDYAKQNDPTIRKSQSDYLQVQEGKVQARSALLPQVVASGRIASNRYIDHGQNNAALENSFSQNKTTSIGLNLQQSLFNLSLWRNLSLQDKAAQQAEVAYQATQQNLLYRVTVAYIEVLNYIEQLALADAELKVLKQQQQKIKQQYQVGVVSINDLNQIDAELDAAQANQIMVKNGLDNSIEALHLITGKYPQFLQKLNVKNFKLQPEINVDRTIETAEQHNLTLKHMQMGAELAKEGIKVASSGHLPTVNLVLGVNRIQSNIPMAANYGINDKKLDQASVAIEFSMPLYSGGRISSQVRQQQQAYLSYSEELSLTHHTLLKNIRSAVNSLKATESSIKAAEQYVRSATRAYQSTVANYDVGTVTTVEVLNSIKNQYGAQRQLSEARHNYLLLQLQLKQLMGTLDQKDLVNLDQLLTQRVNL